MGRSKGTPKSILIATRVTPRIEKLVKQMAQLEGLYVSEWVRNIIISELGKNDMLQSSVHSPPTDFEKL